MFALIFLVVAFPSFFYKALYFYFQNENQEFITFSLFFFSLQISRQSIDACKDYFRDDLLKSDWTLMVELKKTFQIL